MPISTLPWSGYSAKTTQKLPWTGYSQKAVTPTAPPTAPTPTEGIPPFGLSPFGPTMGMEATIKAAKQAKAIIPLSEIPPIVIKPADLDLPPTGLGGLGGQVYDRPNVELTFGYNEKISSDVLVLHNGKKIGTVDDKGNIKLDDPMYVWKTIVPSYWERQRFKQEGKYPAEKILQNILKASRWFYSPKEIAVFPLGEPSGEGEMVTGPSPAQVLGVVGAIGSLVTMGYQGITALQQVGWSGVRNELLAPFKSTLDTYIKHNTKDIALLAQRDPTTLSGKQRLLQNIYNFHNEYMARRAREIAAAQLQARMGHPATTIVEQEIRQLTSATQTANSVADAIRTGEELTTTSLQGLVATGTPTEFTSGINAIISGQAISAVTGAVPEGVEFRSITTKVGKGYEILQNNEVVGTVSYSTEVPGVDGIVMGRIDIAEAARRQGLATQAIQRILSEAEASGIPLYTGLMEPDGVQLFNALEQRGIVSLTPAPERMLGNVVTRGVSEYAPTTAMAEWETVTGAGIPTGKVEVSRFVAASEARRTEIKLLLAEPAKNLPAGVTKVALRKELESITGQLATVSKKQKAKAHIIASEKALVTKAGKTTPQYRQLAEGITGKRSMKEMTLEEASDFIEALERYPEKKWSAETGTWIPQSIPATEAIVPENYFNLKFGEPTPIKYFTSQTYYATKLGAGPLVEPLEIAKQELDLVYPAWRGAIDAKINELNKAYKVTIAEKLATIKANKPTRASAEMAQLLNRYEDLPPELVDSLGMEKVKIFSWFRNLSRTMLNGQNQVREILGMPAIPHREAYFSHIASKTAEEVMMGIHPLPADLVYWSKQVVGKKVFNPRAIQRQLKDDLLEYFSKDLGYVTKSMVNTALKEIYLSQPLKAFNAQLNALNKGLMPFDSLTPAELTRASLINPLPASTRKWLVDYVNIVIKGQQTELDASINRVITQTGIGGLFDKFLIPFGRSVGLKPVTKVSQFLGRAIIYATIGTKPRQIIRNLGQFNQDIALHGIVATLKSFLPADKNLTRMLDSSLYLKSYAIMEEMPTATMSEVGRKWMWAYGKSAVFNARKSMKAAYHSKGHYFTNPQDAKYGWADPARTYAEPKGFLYDSEYKKLLKEAEFSSGAAQYQYNPMGMPEIFRHKTLIPLTRLQSWWMNHFFKFHREALSRFWNGHVGWDPNLKLNWSDRLNWFKYLIIGGAILTALGYERSFGKDVLPHWSPPGAQVLMGAYNYVIASSDYEREQAQRQMFYSLRAFVPGLIDFNHYKDIWSGEKPLSSLFFYTEDWPPDMPTWGIPALVAEVELGHRIKRINTDSEEWVSKLGTLIPAEDETESYTYEMTDFASDIWSELRNVPEAYRTKERGFSDIIVMYEEARSLWDEHYYSLPASERQEFIQRDSPLSIQVGAHLVLWGKLKATGWASGNPQTLAMVENLMNQYNIPIDAVPSMGEVKGETEEEGGLPWSSGGTTGGTTGELPWSGYSAK